VAARGEVESDRREDRETDRVPSGRLADCHRGEEGGESLEDKPRSIVTSLLAPPFVGVPPPALRSRSPF